MSINSQAAREAAWEAGPTKPLLTDEQACLLAQQAITGSDAQRWAAEGRIFWGCSGPDHRRRARLAAVMALTLRNRMVYGEPRGMIPGGECEAAYIAAIRRGEDNPPVVWRDSPATRQEIEQVHAAADAARARRIDANNARADRADRAAGRR